MAEDLQVSCVQLHWAKSLERNLERTLHYIKAAAAGGQPGGAVPRGQSDELLLPLRRRAGAGEVAGALEQRAARRQTNGIWVIAGTIRKTPDRFLNLAHVIAPGGAIVHEYAKVHMAGRDEKSYCRGGDKLSLFEIDGILCTLVICRDGRHPELYRIPAMAGAQILFHPSCSSDEIEAVAGSAPPAARSSRSARTRRSSTAWRTRSASRRTASRPPAGSFIREPNGIPLAEAGFYQEEMITAILDLARADRSYALDSHEEPPFPDDPLGSDDRGLS